MKPATCLFLRAMRLAEDISGWLYEAAIGENRAMLIEQGQLGKIRIERPTGAVRAGAIVDAKFVRQWVSGRSGIVLLDTGEECLLQPLPKGLTEGAPVRVEIIREALIEKTGQAKRAKARPAMSATETSFGPTLLDQISARDQPVRTVHAHEEDLFAELGWHEATEQAATGLVDFQGGSLIISITPAMTVIDVDGPLPPVELAKRAAKEIARAITKFDLAGSIGVDFPTLEVKSERAEVVAIFDEYMKENCERTAINGFGFMQIVTRKLRPSTLEILQADKLLNAAIGLLRQAERDRGAGELRLHVHPAVAAKLNHRPAWLEELAKRTGRKVAVEVSGNIAINGGIIAA